MQTAADWQPLEGSLDSIFARHPQPLEGLAAGELPAVVLRGAYAAGDCERLIERLIERELLYDPDLPVPEKFLEAAIPEGYYREGRNPEARQAWREETRLGKRRIDIGTSLGYRGSDPEAFFAHAAETIALFEHLFDGLPNPVELMYRRLSELSRTKRAATACEPDGRRYGPAIIRAHYGGYAYKPHFDSVRLREKREDYAVHEFEHQFAGVLVLKNTEREGKTAQCILHRCLWEPEVQPHLDHDTFHEYARERAIPGVEVRLQPGDLYFFNTRNIHEVPGVAGHQPRVVLATFIGYSSDRDEMYVWS